MQLLSIKKLATVEGPKLLEQARNVTTRYGISTGYEVLDNFYRGGGLLPGLTYILGARPGMGKTNLILNLAKNISHNGYPTAIFSLELTKERVLERLAYAEAGIDFMSHYQLREPMSELEINKLVQSIKALQELPIYVEDSTRLTPTRIREILEREADKGIKVFFIDYLHILGHESKTFNREREVGISIETIRDTAKTLGISCVVAAQLNRAAEDSSPYIPSLKNLRDSGAVEQVAFSVMLMYRKDYYVQSGMITGEEGEELGLDGTLDVIVAKNQDGLTGVATLKFDGSTGRITE